MSAKVINPIEQARTSAALVMKGGGTHVHVASDIDAATRRLIEMCGTPKRTCVEERPLTFRTFIAELSFCIINFCYWENDSTKRPGGDSTQVRKQVFAAFGLSPYPLAKPGKDATDVECVECIERLARQIVRGKLPQAQQRVEMLQGLAAVLPDIRKVHERCANDEADVSDVSTLLCTVPGFTGDVFHKRLFFFFMLLHRIYRRCQNLARTLPLPADYQVPKVLRAAHAVTFEAELAALVDSDTAIKSGTLMEVEIRAAAIVAVDRIARHLGLTEEQVDEWLWCSRNIVPGKHHLTFTKDY